MHQRSLFYKQNSDIKSETFVCVKEYNNNYSIFQTHSFLGKEKQMKLKVFGESTFVLFILLWNKNGHRVSEENRIQEVNAIVL